MKKDHAYFYNGKLYPAGTEIPVSDGGQEDDNKGKKPDAAQNAPKKPAPSKRTPANKPDTGKTETSKKDATATQEPADAEQGASAEQTDGEIQPKD